MKTACDRFFKTPELLDLLTSVLDRPCLARLCRTNRRFYRELTPSLYKNLDISGLEQKILISIPCLVALGRNIRHVRSLCIGPIELMFYYNCILALEELQWPISVAPVSESTRPHWLPPADCRTCQIVPLPPATNLRELILTDEISDYLRYRLRMASDPKAVMAIFCWFVFLNPRLTRLTSGFDPVMDLSGCRLFAKAVSKLTHLTDLDVVFYNDDLRFQIGSELFFSCCPSIRAFKLVFEDEYMNNDVTEWKLCGLAEDDADWTTVIRKQEPLANLETLVLWDLEEDASTDAILAIFAHCPNIKTLNIDYFSEHYDHQAIGEFIGKECPKIQTLSCGSPEWELDVNSPLLLRILETLPTQQLEVMSFCGSFSPFFASSFARPIQRHSVTLHTIHIYYTATIARISVALIFEECINLKELDIDSGRQCETGLFATLFDVLERPWNTSKLAKLSLAISGCELPVESEEQQPYYDRSAPISLSKAETDHFARLEELYRRVGLLVELEYLDLVMVILDAEGRINAALMNKRRNFPAMLTVGDPKTGRPGYLKLLQGLKNLRWLRGSVHADSAESTATVGLEECFWIHAHWPQIQSIELFPNNAQLRKPFKWLQAQRKNMTAIFNTSNVTTDNANGRGAAAMETACERFFDTPELCNLITASLRLADISLLTLIASLPSLVTLGRNAHHARTLRVEPIELAYLYNCMLAFETIRPPLSDKPTTAQPRPLRLPPANHQSRNIVPLPPMMNLRRLVLTAVVSEDADEDEALEESVYRLPFSE